MLWEEILPQGISSAYHFVICLEYEWEEILRALLIISCSISKHDQNKCQAFNKPHLSEIAILVHTKQNYYGTKHVFLKHLYRIPFHGTTFWPSWKFWDSRDLRGTSHAYYFVEGLWGSEGKSNFSKATPRIMNKKTMSSAPIFTIVPNGELEKLPLLQPENF